MALQELSPLPQIAAGPALGSVLLQAGQTYQNRMANLADQRSAREFASAEAEKASGRALTNETEMAQRRAYMAGVQVLINEGYLVGSDRDNPEAVKTAFERAQAEGTVARYKELLETPDENGKPLLTVEDSVDPAKVAAAKNKLGQVRAGQTQFALDQRTNAQATVNEIQGQLAAVRQRSGEIAARMDAPMPTYSPTSPEVLQLARQLAEQAKPGSGRDKEAVAQMMPVAQKQLDEQAQTQYILRQQSARRELESLRYNEAQLTNALREAMGTFKVAPNSAALRTPVTTGGTSAAPEAQKAASADQIAAAMRAAIGGGGETGSAPASASSPEGFAPIENPTNDPTIAAGNKELQRRATIGTTSKLEELQQKAKMIDSELASLRVDTPVSAPTFGGSTYGFPASKQTQFVRDPVAKAQRASALLKQKAALDEQARMLQAQLMGPMPAAVAPAVVNTPATSTPTLGAAGGAPAWWQTAPAMR
jgi:hypothetical protein